ncbi:MAG: DUF998 domain-containing protein [Promethearchaeota archaeon]
MSFKEIIYQKLIIVRKEINKIRKKFYDKVTDFDFVKKCMLIIIPGYLGLLIIGVIIAYLFGGTVQGPGQYYIWTNWISDLGGSPYTPAPYLYDIAAIIAGILTIPLTFYLEKLLVPLPEKPEEYKQTTRLRYRLGSYAFIFSIIGNLGYIGVGIWSEDRGYMKIGDYNLPMHGIMSGLAFGGFTLGAFFLGWIIILYDVKIPKIIGIYGAFGPLLVLILFGIIGGPLWEWLLLISILAWIIPISLTILANEELHLKNVKR